MDYLTEEQKASFAATNALVGLGPEEFTEQISERDADAPLTTRIMSGNSDESHYPPHYVAVGSIAELRKIAGFPEEHVDTGQDEPDYPAPLGEKEADLINNSMDLKSAVDDDLQQRITKAAEAYVMGNPEKVREYESLINATQFPGQVAVFAGDTLDVPADTTHVIGGSDPVVLNYAKIIVGENATISIQTNATISAQVFIQQ